MTYVAGLQLKENTYIRRQRVLIFPGTVQASVGQEVQPDTILAKTELLPGVPVAVDLASYFQIDPAHVPAVMQKQTGDYVLPGEVLAVVENSLLAGGKKVYTSPFRGLIEHISASRGIVLIREEAKEDEPVVVVDAAKALNISPRFLRAFVHVQEGDEVLYGSVLASSDGYGADAVRAPIRGIVASIDTRSGTISLMKPYSPSYARAYLAGRVVEIIPERGAVVEASGSYLEGVFGVGGERYGILTKLAAERYDNLDAHHFSEEHEGCVVWGGAGITLAGMQAALKHKVAGVIVGGLKSSNLVQLLGQEISIGITGQEDIHTTFIATEGFGDVPMLDLTYDLLARHVGCMTSLNGRTQIRAGVQRPEIIISHPVAGTEAQVAPEAPTRLAVGMRVRAIVAPYFGQTGEVMAILPPKELPTEVKMSLLQVRLSDGRVVELLPNNVEGLRGS